MHKDGKINLSEESREESSTKEEVLDVEPSTKEGGFVTEEPSHHPQHHYKSSNPILSFFVEFTNASFGDRMKTTVVILLFFFLIANGISWRLANGRLIALEEKLRSMEEYLKQTQQVYQILNQVQRQIDQQGQLMQMQQRVIEEVWGVQEQR